MHKLRIFVYGLINGMICEYLYRVEFNIFALAVATAIFLMMLEEIFGLHKFLPKKEPEAIVNKTKGFIKPNVTVWVPSQVLLPVECLVLVVNGEESKALVVTKAMKEEAWINFDRIYETEKEADLL